MSLRDCINRAVRAGLMDKERAALARNLFDENYDQARLNLGDTEAMAQARVETMQIIRYQMAQIRREKLLQVARAKSILETAQNSGVPLNRAIEAVFDFDPGVDGVANLAKRRDTLRGVLHSEMDKFLATFRRDLVGRTRNKATFSDMLREVHGESTGNASAKELAGAWTKAAEKGRLMFNHAGGDIPKLEKWGLPHSHDFIAVRNAGFDKWFDDILPMLEVRAMKDHRTGKSMNEFSLKQAAREAYDNISTEGWANRKAGSSYGQKLARRHLDHRFFVFKNSDAWLAYHDQYGGGDVFSVMMGHLDGMARDTAAMQILGPNPTAMTRWMGDVVEKDFRTRALADRLPTDKLESKARKSRKLMESMYEHYTGSVNAPIDGKMARVFAGTRSTLQSAQLGAAMLSALSDLGFGHIAAGNVGIPYRKILARQVSLLNPKNIVDQRAAVRLGLIADNWSTLAVAQQRYLGEVSGPEITRRLADFTMRVSGLSPWTQAGRHAFGMEFAGLMADNADRAFAALPKPLRKTMKHYDISAFDWDMARQSPMLDHKGVKFLRAEDIADQEVAFKFLDMVHTETEFAVPSTSLRGRSLLIGEAKPGTIQGELIRSTAMYKNFAVTLLMTHFRRALSMPTKYESGRYAVQLLLTTAILGGFSTQMKQISRGRDPRKMFDLNDPASMAKFWLAATIQGGGLGIFGDFLYSQKNRFGGGLAQTVAGPVVGLGADIIGTVNQNIGKVLEGKKTRAAADVIDLVQRYAPGSSIWYLRAGFEHIIFDELRKIADPKATQRMKRIERRHRRDFGQGYWYKKGNVLPHRLPDLTTAFGGK